MVEGVIIDRTLTSSEISMRLMLRGLLALVLLFLLSTAAEPLSAVIGQILTVSGKSGNPVPHREKGGAPFPSGLNPRDVVMLD